MTTSEDERRMEARILKQLYEPFFTSFDAVDLRILPEQEGWGRVAFDNMLEQMSNAWLIRHHAIGYWYMLSGRGAIHAEELGVAPAELVRANQRARTGILLALAEVYEKKGRLYSKFKGELESELGIDSNSATANLHVLGDLEYVSPTGNAGYKIEDPGIQGPRAAKADCTADQAAGLGDRRGRAYHS
jgi:hypothetical protein